MAAAAEVPGVLAMQVELVVLVAPVVVEMRSLSWHGGVPLRPSAKHHGAVSKLFGATCSSRGGRLMLPGECAGVGAWAPECCDIHLKASASAMRSSSSRERQQRAEEQRWLQQVHQAAAITVTTLANTSNH